MRAQRFWVLVSRNQQSTHCEPVGEGLLLNLKAFARGRLQDYVPIAEFGNEAEARAFQEVIAPLVGQVHRRDGGSR
jgi:hypothetical protein